MRWTWVFPPILPSRRYRCSAAFVTRLRQVTGTHRFMTARRSYEERLVMIEDDRKTADPP